MSASQPIPPERRPLGGQDLAPLVEHHLDHLRDDVTGALDDDGVAHADVLARDLIGIVQRGTCYGRTGQ